LCAKAPLSLDTIRDESDDELDESNDELDDGNIDTDHDIDELDLDNFYNDCGNSKLKEWIAGIKCDPLRCACRIIHLLWSLDQCRKGFHRFI
jgi:hypothetical protein